jgi:hypothetical protein
MLLSDALEGRRAGRLCRIAAALSDGTDTLGRSTLLPPVSASLDLALRSAADAPLALERGSHDRVLSELAVRESGFSMLRLAPVRRRGVGVDGSAREPTQWAFGDSSLTASSFLA